MRLFVAAWPTADAVAELEAKVAPLRIEQPDLKWQPAGRWHLTVTFIGDVDDERQPAAQQAVEQALHEVVVADPVHLAGSGTFGRLLWVGLEPQPSPLTPVARGVARRLRAARFAIERRRYHPHLTLARTRGEASGLLAAKHALAGFSGLEWRVTELTLVRSQTGPDPSYEVLERFPVRAG